MWTVSQHRRQRCTRIDPLEHHIRRDSVLGLHAFDDSPILQVEPFVMARGQQGPVTSANRSANSSRTTTPACSARIPVSRSGFSHALGGPSSTCACPSEKGRKPICQSGAKSCVDRGAG
jgi:hypothetical protein